MAIRIIPQNLWVLFFIFWLHHATYKILSPQPGIERMQPAGKSSVFMTMQREEAAGRVHLKCHIQLLTFSNQ